jgi:hypothetical protein
MWPEGQQGGGHLLQLRGGDDHHHPAMQTNSCHLTCHLPPDPGTICSTQWPSKRSSINWNVKE